MVSKIFIRIAGLVVAAVAGALVLLAGGLGTAHAATDARQPTAATQLSSTASATPSSTASTSPKNQGSAEVTPTNETRALVVGTVAFVLMVGTAGAVVWHTARTRSTPH